MMGFSLDIPAKINQFNKLGNCCYNFVCFFFSFFVLISNYYYFLPCPVWKDGATWGPAGSPAHPQAGGAAPSTFHFPIPNRHLWLIPFLPTAYWWQFPDFWALSEIKVTPRRMHRAMPSLGRCGMQEGGDSIGSGGAKGPRVPTLPVLTVTKEQESLKKSKYLFFFSFGSDTSHPWRGQVGAQHQPDPWGPSSV